MIKIVAYVYLIFKQMKSLFLHHVSIRFMKIVLNPGLKKYQNVQNVIMMLINILKIINDF